jgi:undecaprenyl-diphosphatase
VGLYRDRFLGLIPGKAAVASASATTVDNAVDNAVGREAVTEHGSDASGFAGWRGLGLLALTTLPALVAGKAAHHYIKDHLFNTHTVAIGLAIGGVGLILVERFRPVFKKSGLDALGWQDAVWIGLFQCLALWPGMSRSGSTIIGGMLKGIDRKTTAEYSFLAAVPVMMAATSYDLYKSRAFLHASDAPLFAVGFLVSLVSAWFAIRFFMRFLATHTLQGFGWYRIALAAFTLWYFAGRSLN